jgi:dual specificity tyrosine-phosphorylation-regulated kinase 2/3/4
MLKPSGPATKRNENDHPLNGNNSSHVKRRLSVLTGPRPMDNSRSHVPRKQPANSSTSSFDHIYREAMDLEPKNASSDFLPQISFDDMHSNITDLNSRFPTLSNASPSKDTTTPSLVPRRRQASQSSVPQPPSMPPPSAPRAANGRGQQQQPPTTYQPTTSMSGQRPIRKSVGPGAFVSQRSRSASREPRIPNAPTQASLMRSGSISKPLLNPHDSRIARTKSLQPPPPGQTHSNLLSQSISSVTSDNGASPRLRNGNLTPSSANANRRLSTAVHVGGLGARTISPTDARRMKRLSSVPRVPPPPASPKPLPSFSQPNLLRNFSPQVNLPPPPPPSQSTTSVFSNSVPSTSTPPPLSYTPDFLKTSSLNQSTSSTSSFSMPRPTNANPARQSQILAGSRLPAPKPRNVHSSVGFAEEEVPPVPAIPKAYESPKDQLPEPSYFIARKSISTESDVSNPNSRPPTAKLSGPAIPQPQHQQQQQQQQQQNTRHRRGLTVGAGSDSDKPSNQQNSLSKKNLQPIRLPPLNLLPLSTPTSSRIASLPPSQDNDSRHSTPPPKRNATKTPSTPMTASKATFFPTDDDFATSYNYRSNTSHHPSRPDDIDSHLGFPILIPQAGPRNHNASPFASNSLPKLTEHNHSMSPTTSDTAVNFSHSFHQPVAGATPVTDSDTQSTPKVTSAQAAQPVNPSARTSSSDEPNTPASSTGNSLRRKLSLTWKRSSSKASQRAQNERDEKAKQNEMPPPKIPASATWSTRTSSDSGSNRPVLDSKARKPSFQRDGNVSDNVKVEPGPPPFQRSASTSLLTPVQRMLGAKGSLNTLKSRNLDTNLDKDDFAADKVMEKLGSKRKDFETAAKQLDELRRRATVKERASPAQAIQTVNLNIFERGEIVDFKDVYFCGTKSAKKIVGDPAQTATNFGYDDDRGDYKIIFGDHLAYRYEVVDLLGKGSFGQVVRCIDHKTGGLVAVKIIRNKKRFHQQALVEVNILQKLREWVCFYTKFMDSSLLTLSTRILRINIV